MLCHVFWSQVEYKIVCFISTYKSRGWVWSDPGVIPIEPGNQLYYLIEKISNLLAGSVTLFLINDIIADETLEIVKCRF